jgi:phage baseplate assembly protein gpV
VTNFNYSIVCVANFANLRLQVKRGKTSVEEEATALTSWCWLMNSSWWQESKLSSAGLILDEVGEWCGEHAAEHHVTRGDLDYVGCHMGQTSENGQEAGSFVSR